MQRWCGPPYSPLHILSRNAGVPFFSCLSFPLHTGLATLRPHNLARNAGVSPHPFLLFSLGSFLFPFPSPFILGRRRKAAPFLFLILLFHWGRERGRRSPFPLPCFVLFSPFLLFSAYGWPPSRTINVLFKLGFNTILAAV